MVYQKSNLFTWNFLGISSFVVIWLAQNCFPLYSNINLWIHLFMVWFPEVHRQLAQSFYVVIKSVTKYSPLDSLTPQTFFPPLSTLSLMVFKISILSGTFFPPRRLCFLFKFQMLPLFCRTFSSLQILALIPFQGPPVRCSAEPNTHVLLDEVHLCR